MTKKEMDELNELARRILVLCAQAEIDRREYEEQAIRQRKRFALVKQEEEGIKNEQKLKSVKGRKQKDRC